MTQRVDETPNLVGMSRTELAPVLEGLDSRPFRATQIYHWLNRRLVATIDEMSDLPKALRQSLAAHCRIADPVVVESVGAEDGARKLALRLDDGEVIEAVLMAMEGHETVCLSSQTGCAVGCAFCVTGALGAGRNLSASEIFGQYRAILRHAGEPGASMNVVFMGMGEPLLNIDALERAIELLSETVSPKRITVSTSGIVPGLRSLARMPRQPKLAVSLNATTQQVRERLMPGAARWPLDDLLAELRRFPLSRGRRITIEYVLIAGQNDTQADAARLPRLLAGIPCKVNLIPLNGDDTYIPGLAAPDTATIDSFAATLARAHLNVTVRWSKGVGIAAACGQLKGRHLELPGNPPSTAESASTGLGAVAMQDGG
jgi:23S rRNA (adenine2503-C2)-methyltransferase